jgi:hypothetical protein
MNMFIASPYEKLAQENAKFSGSLFLSYDFHARPAILPVPGRWHNNRLHLPTPKK